MARTFSGLKKLSRQKLWPEIGASSVKKSSRSSDAIYIFTSRKEWFKWRRAVFFSIKNIMDSTSEIINRCIKYLVEGLFVAVAAIFIPKRTLPPEEIVSLAIVAAAVFAILDVVSPSIGSSARQGAGFGLGANLVGFPR